MNKALRLICFLSIGLAIPGADGWAQTSALYQQTSEVNNLMVQYDADRGSLSRFYAVEGSPDRRNRLLQLQNDYLKQLQQLKFESLPVGSKADYLLFKRNMDEQVRLLQEEEAEYTQLAPWFSFSEKIYEIERIRRRGTQQDAQKLAATANALSAEISGFAKKLDKEGAIDINLSRRAGGILRGLQYSVKSVNDFYTGYDPSFSWWTPEPFKKLDNALSDYAKSWQQKEKSAPGGKDDGSGIIGYPIGQKELVRQLQAEMIPYTPEELVDIANKEFAWCDAEMLKASREMGFGDDWKKAVEKVKNSYVPPGKQPEAIMKLYNESIDFLKKNKLITIPPLAEETWRMSMMSPQRQLVSPFFLGGEMLIISYPTHTMAEDDKLMSMRGNNPHFSRATVHHELIAGHHLQGFMNNRYKSYRNFNTPFWTEGWALYWELILWDMKFPQSPEDRIGMLFWRMHRCARIIFSLNYHLNKWTPQQCIDFLVDRVCHERANAEGEVRRSFTGGYGPLYQLAYMIGGLQFYNMKKELVDSGKMTYKQYHDAVMQENAMPVEMLRVILENQNVSKDFKTNWRFYSK
ncbi:DUF885 family protein [Paraflavitalea sp. CAU 1676]|uniref:DUF885 family protein n=1 Tax=Paraflavitalea sp. CAU 1676 TaxID=3032598 RepID=UPI0023DBA795|nr:DUF885 family protein [Paraflavitalea sp. CAU 1676]MDF2190475.1 DUF885 family protein [Paraflavitalea sp. CAU 1676]